MSKVVELLQELVRIPSVNPQGDPGTDHVGEGVLAQYVGDLLVDMGLEVEMQFVEPERPNVIGRLKSKNSKKHILLGPHTDTVSVLGMTIEPFSGEIRDGRVWGRGSSDTKGPMAAMLCALETVILNKKILQDTDIWFLGLMGEESGNDGIAYLMDSDYFPQKGIRPDFGIAGEPTDLRIVYRHKGAMWFKLRVKGKACHASRADLGDNAILKMQHAINYVSKELPKVFSKYQDPELGEGSFNVTMIRGGSKVNIIPDICEIEVDHRSMPQEKHSEVLDHLKQALPDCDIEIISDRPGLNTSASDPYIKKLSGILNVPHPLTVAPWFADCALMWKAGVPSIAFGPGSITQAHTKDEFIDIVELEKGVDVFHRFFMSLD